MVNINTTPCGRRGRNTDVKLDTLEIGKDAVVASVASDDQHSDSIFWTWV